MEPQKKKRNKKWQENHIKIREAYVDLIQVIKRKPTLQEVSDVVKISVNSVQKHISELRFNPETDETKILFDDLIISIIQHAMKGNAGMAKLAIQIFRPDLLEERVHIGGEIQHHVMLIPHNNRDSGIEDAQVIPQEQWDKLEEEVQKMRLNGNK